MISISRAWLGKKSGNCENEDVKEEIMECPDTIECFLRIYVRLCHSYACIIFISMAIKSASQCYEAFQIADFLSCSLVCGISKIL